MNSSSTAGNENGDAGDRLNSWKEIAAYLGRDVRTVQRWERERDLPVRRLKHSTRSTVYATTHDLDGWLAARTEGEANEGEAPTPPSRTWMMGAGLAVVGVVIGAYWLSSLRSGSEANERPPIEASNVPPAEARLLVLADEPGKCLHKELYHWRDGIRIHLWDCEVDRADNNANKYWFYEESSGLIRMAFNTSWCMVRAEPDAEPDKAILLWDCDAAADDLKRWTFDPSSGALKSRDKPAYCLQENIHTEKRTQKGQGKASSHGALRGRIR